MRTSSRSSAIRLYGYGPAFFSFLVSVWYFAIGGVLLGLCLNMYLYTEWSYPVYNLGQNVTTYLITHTSSPATFSSLSMWIPVVFTFFVPGALFLLAALQSLCFSQRVEVASAINAKEKEKEVADPDDQVTPLLLVEKKNGASQQQQQQQQLGKETIDPDSYMPTMLFLSRFFAYPFIVIFLYNGIVSKSVTVALGQSAVATMLNFVFYLGDGVYQMIYGEHATNASPVAGFPHLIGAIMLFVMWAISFFFFIYPLSLTIANFGIDNIPYSIRVMFYLFISLLSFDSLRHLFNIFYIWKAFIPAKYSAAKNHSMYLLCFGFSIVVTAVFTAGIFLVMIIQTLGESGYRGL